MNSKTLSKQSTQRQCF